MVKTGEKTGNLTIISGFSGSGKSSIVRELLKMDENYVRSVSVTTRQKRKDEVDGKDYFFVSETEFHKMSKCGDFLEETAYCGSHYGTSFRFVMDKLGEEKDVLLIMDQEGAGYVKGLFPSATTIYIIPPNFAELRRRLEKRGTETPESINARIRKACEEAYKIPQKYDYIVVNNLLDDAARLAHMIIQSKKAAVANNLEKISDLIASYREI